LRYQHASEIGTDLRRLRRDADSRGRDLEPLEIPSTGSALRASSSSAKGKIGGRRRTLLVATGIVFFILIASFAIFRYHNSPVRLGINIPSQKNLVVLPFSAVGGGPEQVYCDGFTETVTAKLASESSLQVPAALEIRAKNVVNVEQARTQLGANLVLIASWQRVGRAARINLSLVDAKTGQQLRTDTITEPADDLFTLQDQVVLKTLRMLDVQPSASSSAQLVDHGTTKLSAYDFYVQGIGYLQRYERLENVDTAISLFQRAIKEDPNYAEAQAGLAQAFWYKYSATKDPQWVKQAKGAVKAAENLDSRSPEVQLAIGNLNRRTGSYPAAISAFQHVLDSDPKNVDAYLGLGNTYDALGRVAEAEQAFRHAIEIRPSCWICFNQLGVFLNQHSRYREAAEAWQKVTELAPDNVWGYMNVGVVCFNIGQFERAETFFRRGLAVAPNNPDLYANLGTVSFFLGHFDEDVRYTNQAIALQPKKYDYWGNLADAYRMIPAETEKAKMSYRQAISLASNQ